MFKSWGVTSFEMAPQFVSAEMVLSLTQLSKMVMPLQDRYDLAMSKNNKYGSKEDLRDALKALHKAGIQAIADWVPDQIYQLPGKEVVTATRTDGAGRKIADAIIDHSLYVANTKSSGKDYQAKYGGEFLAELKAKYPEMFKVNMISTGKPIDDSVKLKQWKAKYFNGTNVLDRGVGYVLSDESTGKYFTVTKEGNFIPLQLTGNEKAVTGFSNDGKGITYFGTSGTQAKSAFVTFNGNTYYFDARGHMITNGEYSPNGKDVYRFLPGIMLSNAYYVDANGNTYLYNSKGQMYKGGYTKFDVTETDKDGKESKVVKFRYFTNEGVMAKGVTVIDGFTQYFGEDGFQAKDKLVTFKGKTYY
ncbi:MAG: glycoside hydrolase family 70 protein, partial [Streptococcus salivarius]